MAGRKRTREGATAHARLEARRTAANKKRFLAVYRAVGNVSVAARTARISRRAHYEWLERDADYTAAFDDAVEEAGDVLEAEARRRAVAGVAEPVFYQGDQVATVQKYSDVLLIFLLKGARPETYAERHVHGGKGKRGAILLEEIVAGVTDGEK